MELASRKSDILETVKEIIWNRGNVLWFPCLQELEKRGIEVKKVNSMLKSAK